MAHREGGRLLMPFVLTIEKEYNVLEQVEYTYYDEMVEALDNNFLEAIENLKEGFHMHIEWRDSK